ncbi:hypothetical protein HHI36_004899 [Cryptolaemus montrouzieri]|uniref:Uncharacterized protein n=1 Tax=Cryptolaemus montrouzieri TaxID=559131 RepID=A0ABD2NSZ8_9CUCU
MVYYAIRQVSCTVVEMTDYIEKAERNIAQQGDVSTYTNLSSDPTSATQTKFNDFMKKFRYRGYVGDTIERDSLSSDKLSSEISKKSTESVRSSISSTTCVSESLMSSEREILDPHDEFEFKLDSLHKTTNISDMGKKDETTHNKEDTEEIQQWVEQGIRPLRKKNSARERPIICPICFDDVMTHFTRHLFRHHTTDPCVQNILKLSPKSTAERANRNCLARSQTFLATLKSKNQDFLQSSRIKEEVFGLMRADDISYTAKSDPSICLYGETLLKKHKRQQICTTISNKMREMSRMLIALKDINSSVHMLFDAMKPGMFQDIITVTKVISGYA